MYCNNCSNPMDDNTICYNCGFCYWCNHPVGENDFCEICSNN